MALYVTLGSAELTRITEAFGLGGLKEATGIPQGSINTNYRVETQTGRYFVRLTTVRSEADLAYEAALLGHLANAHFPAPKLLPTVSGPPFLPLKGGRVSVFGYLPGEELTKARLTAEHCERLGAELARLHRATNSFTQTRENPYGPGLVRGWLEQLAGEQDRTVAALAPELLSALEESTRDPGGLQPRGTLHADLFMDNVKWVADRVSAFFDFEMACTDAFILDLAITLNAWCFDGGYDVEKARAMMRGYESERPLGAIERGGLHARLLFGAVRYAASRIRDFHLAGVGAEKLAPKDYRTYLARVRALRELGSEGLLRMLGADR